MVQIFPSLVIADLFLLTGTGVLGLLVDGNRLYPQHFILALFSILFTIFIHVVVFTYFAASGRMMMQALLIGRLDTAPLDKLKWSKAKAGRMVGLSVLSLIAAICFGALIESDYGWRWWHLTAAAGAVTVNAWAFYVEYDLVTRNAQLMAEVFSEYNAARDNPTER